MKNIMKKLLPVLLVAFTMGTLGVAPAAAAGEVPEITIETVSIGNAGNAADVEDVEEDEEEQWDNTNGYGAVNYAYAIGKTEVTTAQYAAFLNAVAKTDTYGLYSSYMADDCGLTRSGSEGSWVYEASTPTKPVMDVTFWNALRFANWLTNGQPEGAQDGSTTEDGMYALNGYTGSSNIAVPRKLSGTGWALPSEDEWYKAAYYNQNPADAIADGTYTQYATGDTITQDQANYGWGEEGNTTEVGYYAPEQNGTYDMTGNVWEWTEAADGEYRVLRGGAFSTDSDSIASSGSNIGYPNAELKYGGFRVSKLVAAVPEPGTYGVMAGAVALLGAVALRKRNRRA